MLEESRSRVADLGDRLGGELSVGERESCEALTARFARLNDFLVQRVLRTLRMVFGTPPGPVIPNPVGDPNATAGIPGWPPKAE